MKDTHIAAGVILAFVMVIMSPIPGLLILAAISIPTLVKIFREADKERI